MTVGGLVVEGAIGQVPLVLGDVVWLALGAANLGETVVEPKGNGGADSDGQLLQRDEGATELWGRNLGLVKGDDHGEHADTHTTNDTTREKHTGVLGRTLQAGSEGEDEDGKVHRVLAGDAVGEETTAEGAEPGTKFKSSNEPTLDGVAHEAGELGLKVLWSIGVSIVEVTNPQTIKNVNQKGLPMTRTGDMTP